MTIDMTFEAREKIIRRDEFAAGKAEGILDTLRKIVEINIRKGLTIEEIAEITGENVEMIEKIVEDYSQIGES